jgi:hypothetical protein
VEKREQQVKRRRLSWMAITWIIIPIVVVVEIVLWVNLSARSPSPQPYSEFERARGSLSLAARYDPPDVVSKAYENFLAQYPDDLVTRRDCVAFYRKNRNPIKALEHAQKLLKENAKSLDDLLLCGDAALEAGIVMKAYQYFKDAQQIAPRDPRTFKGLARTYQAEGQIQLAIASIQKAINLNPKDEEARRLLATLQNEMSQSRMRQPGMPGVPDPMAGMPRPGMPGPPRVPRPGMPDVPGSTMGGPHLPGHDSDPFGPTPGIPDPMSPRPPTPPMPGVPRPGQP